MPEPTARGRPGIVFCGTPAFAASHLDALVAAGHAVSAVFTQPDRPAGRGRRQAAGPVKTLALEQGITVHQPLTLRDPAALEVLQALAPDVIVVVAYGLLLPQRILDLPRLGCINVHASALPRWRGAAPIQRAIEAGDPESGVDIMRMERGLDTGPVLASARCPITPTMTAGELEAELALLGPALLLSVLADLPAHLARACPQDASGACYAHKIDKAEAELDWRLPATTLARRVRAFNPFPVAFARLGDERIRIWRAQAAAGAGEPGVILGADGGVIEVACGQGSLRLQELQLPGGRALAAPEILRGAGDRFRAGRRFDGVAAAG